MQESEFIAQLKTGNEKVFRMLLDRYQKIVLHTCMGFTGNLNDAQDIAQMVFIEVFKSINSFNQKSSLSTWIYRISVNKSLNYIRDNKKYRLQKRIDDLFFDNEVHNKEVFEPISEKEPDYDLLNSDNKKIFRQALSMLKEKQRTAFVLYAYNNLKYSEIAAVMGLSLSAVESLIHRAKKILYNFVKDNI